MFNLATFGIDFMEGRVWTVQRIELRRLGVVKGMLLKSRMVHIIAHSAEDSISHAVAVAAVGIKRRPVFPNVLTSARYLKDTSGSPFTDQGVAVGQPSGAADIGGIKVHGIFRPIFPNDIVGLRVDLDRPAEIRREEIDRNHRDRQNGSGRCQRP